MKYMKSFCLTMVITAALMAMAGAGTASATVLCATTSTPCTARYQAATAYDAEAVGNSIFEIPGNGTELTNCKEGIMEGEFENEGGATKTTFIWLGGIAWNECSAVTETVANGELEIHHIAGTDNGTVTALRTEVTIVFAGVDCVYGVGAATDLGTLTGGAEALDISATLVKVKGGILCPVSATWTAQYKVKKPQPLFVEAQ